MHITLIPLLDDNYGYLVMDQAKGVAAVVDPVEPQKVKTAVDIASVEVTHVLTTHKHWDHAGGNEAFKGLTPNVIVVGRRRDRRRRGLHDACQTRRPTQHRRHQAAATAAAVYWAGGQVTCIHTPGHTKGHISYYCEHNDSRAVFTGDCLFVGGAGKFFEGTGDDMHLSLCERLGKLPPDTEVYCGHEYTLQNYKFAASLEPGNTALLAATAWAKNQRDVGRPTVPSTVAKELDTNPFLRVESPDILAKCPLGAQSTPPDVLQWVRDAKNAFK